VKYNRDGGTVVVDTAWRDPRRVRVTIQDSGHGLSPAQRAQLFQPFNRLGQEAGPEEGSGIGLVVTKRLVELMGGEIGLSSTLGVGTVFWIDLEATAPVQIESLSALLDEAGTARAAPLPHGRDTLLYVEDNPANLRLVEEIVALRTGLNLLTASNGTLGLALAREHRPDVILMDLNLPGIDGTECLRILKREPRTRGIPVIALTANAMSSDVERGLSAGFYRYLTKPLDVGAFILALDDALVVAHAGAVAADA
jgi:CheY-like chemotaxis protein